MQVHTVLDVDVVAVEHEDTVTVLLELEAPPAPEVDGPRPEHTAVVVLDRSGSMSGGGLAHATRALLDLVDRLDDRDRFGLVAFDSEARVIVPAGRVGDLGRQRIRGDIQQIRTGGTTDLSSGYLRGLQEADRVAGDAGATVVLLSDGHANAGITDPGKLSDLARGGARAGTTTSTVGIGLGYDERILSELAAGGSGNHSFAENADAVAAAVAKEVDGLLSKTVQAASLMIEPTGDVRAIGLLNDGLPAHRVDGGVLAELGDFYAGETRRITVSVQVPAMASLGLAKVASFTLRYVDVATLHQHTVTVPVSVDVVPADVASGRVPNPVVEQEKLLQQTQVDKRRAEVALREGDELIAREALSEATDRLLSAPPGVATDELAAEVAWLEDTRDALRRRDAAYTAKRLSSDRWRKSRGYATRPQGGEVPPAPGDGPSDRSPGGGSST